VPLRREHSLVDPALCDQHLRGAHGHAGNRADEVDQLCKRSSLTLDASVEAGKRLVECVDVSEQAGDKDTVMGNVEAVCKRLLQRGDLCTQPAASELRQLIRVADAAEKRLQHRAG
jgi:hypothetical protein